ncbi:hypothetical protein OEA41_002899 [Lepraria neglecta]|uniref:Uncharacterized protein n=1 Tax=Lepraria neglecta TaxID=209136 RepID=A0AAE0DIU9_9LECA|nr:hypothetical protein OEA41_002899 [Lepraria neglecta]
MPRQYHTLTLFRNQVEHLTDLKKAHLKAQKKALKQQAQAKKVAAIWKKKTFKLSRRSSKANTGTNTPAMGGLSRVNSGINTFITNGLSRRSTEANTGANTPAMGGLSRRSSGFVSGNEDNEEDDDTDDDEPDEDEDEDEDEEDVADEEDTLGGLTQLSRKSSEVRHENEFPLQHSTTVLNGRPFAPRPALTPLSNQYISLTTPHTSSLPQRPHPAVLLSAMPSANSASQAFVDEAPSQMGRTTVEVQLVTVVYLRRAVRG